MELNSKTQHYIAWLKAHERLIIIAVLALVGVRFYNRAVDYFEKRDQLQAQVAHDKAVVDNEKSQELLKQLADLNQKYDDLKKSVNQRVQQRAVQTVAQKKKDDTAAPNEVATRITQLLKIAAIEIHTQDTPIVGELVFSNPAAHATVNALEDLEQARADLLDTQTLLNGPNGCTVVVAKQAETITSLNTALASEQDSHKKDVAVEKAKAKHQFWRGFKYGIGIGILGYEAIRVVLHKP